MEWIRPGRRRQIRTHSVTIKKPLRRKDERAASVVPPLFRIRRCGSDTCRGNGGWPACAADRSRKQLQGDFGGYILQVSQR